MLSYQALVMSRCLFILNKTTLRQNELLGCMAKKSRTHMPGRATQGSLTSGKREDHGASKLQALDLRVQSRFRGIRNL